MKPPCLILDKRYYPVMIVNFKKAFLMSLRENNLVLEYHENEYIRSVHAKYRLPIVIQIDEIVKLQNLYVTPTRQLILIRDDYTCQYCGRTLTSRNATIDHVIPKSKGGVWSWTNLVTCCSECNQRKGDNIWRPRNKLKRPEPFIIVFKKLVNKIDYFTLDIWRNWLPIKLRKFIEEVYRQRTTFQEEWKCME